MRNILWLAFAPALALSIVGCADQRLGKDGKAGWITQLYTQEKLAVDRPTCLSAVSAEQIAEHVYVEVSVQNYRSRRYVSALVPPGMDVHLHDQVEITPGNCMGGVVPKVTQKLTSSTYTKASEVRSTINSAK